MAISAKVLISKMVNTKKSNKIYRLKQLLPY